MCLYFVLFPFYIFSSGHLFSQKKTKKAPAQPTKAVYYYVESSAESEIHPPMLDDRGSRTKTIISVLITAKHAVFQVIFEFLKSYNITTLVILRTIHSIGLMPLQCFNFVNHISELSHSSTPVTAFGGIAQTYTHNYVPVTVVGGVLGAALFAAFVVIVVVLIRGSCGAVKGTYLQITI